LTAKDAKIAKGSEACCDAGVHILAFLATLAVEGAGQLALAPRD
jgi:hypothetical protein